MDNDLVGGRQTMLLMIPSFGVSVTEAAFLSTVIYLMYTYDPNIHPRRRGSRIWRNPSSAIDNLYLSLLVSNFVLCNVFLHRSMSKDILIRQKQILKHTDLFMIFTAHVRLSIIVI